VNAAHLLALLIEATAGLVVAAHVLAALGAVLRGRGPEAARLIVAEGAVLALSLEAGAALLKTLHLPGWPQIAAFAAILALRTVLKRVFAAEQARLRPLS
jgi:uncharacterized membrane protein